MSRLDRFTCEEAFRRLDDYLDRELGEAEMMRLHEHLETCAGCAREFNFEASLLEGVKRKIRQIDMPADLLDRVRLALEKDRLENEGLPAD